jgi:alkylated DNA repair protein alkB family protein 1
LPKIKRDEDFKEFNKLRWATIGYHYDWTNKVYNENDFTPVPVDVARLSQLIASLIGFSNYKAEAGIVNYYHLNSTLSGHQDYSEKNMKAPLISISLGNAAIFLVGGQSKAIRPSAVRLTSGDIVVMSGPARLAYHGVPKIIKDPSLDKVFSFDNEEQTFKSREFYVSDQEWSEYYEYIKENRINLNIRQVND